MLTLLVQDRFEGEPGYVEVDVVLLLPAVMVQPLVEIALLVEEADPDEGDAEVGGALEVVAGQDAQASRVHRQRLVQAEFGREVDNGPVVHVPAVNGAPGPLVLHVLVESAERVVDAAVEYQFGGAFLHLFGCYLVQEGDGVVFDLAPQVRVQIGEQVDDLRVPCPPEVLGQDPEAVVQVVPRICHGQLPSLSLK